MKKVVFAVLILVLCCTPLLFTACSNVSQRELLSTSYVCGDDGYELFTYDVYRLDDAGKYTVKVGEMTMKFERLNNKDAILPAVTTESGSVLYAGYVGARLTTHLEVETGNAANPTDTIDSTVLYKSNCTPSFSYKHTVIGGVDKVMQVIYEEKYLYATRYENGVEAASYKHKSSGCYDNETLYAIIRASVPDESSYSLSYTSFNPLTGNADGITISRGSLENENIPLLTPSVLPEGTETFTTPTYNFTIQTDNQYASSYSMELTEGSVTVKNDKIDVTNVKKVITQITEGDYRYVLSGVVVTR